MTKKRLGDFIQEYSVKNKKNMGYPVYSVTSSQGFCTEYFNKDVSGEDKTSYKIVPRGYFAYNPSRINIGSVDWQNKEDYVIVSPLYVVFKCSENLNQDYLKYYLKSDSGKKVIRASVSGSVRNSLKIEVLSNYHFNIGTIEEQLAIVNMLRKIEAAIDNEERQLGLYDELIKSKFVEMFGDPEKNSKHLPLKSLAELGTWSSGGTPARKHPEYFRGEIDWYSAGELNEMYLKGSIEKITKEAIEESSAKLFKAGSMLVGMYDTAAFKMGILNKDSASNQACACVFPNTDVNIVWLYHELSMMKQFFLNQRRGCRQKNLNLGMIKGFCVPVAEFHLQNEFAEYVACIERMKCDVKKRISLYKELLVKKTDELFNGESA